MQDKRTAAEFHQRAAEVRTIARGIFDKTERQLLLKFVDDCEKLATEKARAGKEP